MSYKESSKDWYLPLEGHYLIYGEPGVGKSALASFLLDQVCYKNRKSIYLVTEKVVSALHLTCERVEVAYVSTVRELLLVLLSYFDVDAIALDSISAPVRGLPAEIGTKVSAFTSWLMGERSKRGLFSVTIAQESGWTMKASYYRYLVPWADYVIRVERRGSERVMIVEKAPVDELVGLERCFNLEGGVVNWVDC